MIKKKYYLNFPPETINEPISYNLVKKFDVRINILNANITSGKEGRLLLEMESEEKNLEQAIEYIKSNRVECLPMSDTIHFKKDYCVHCGSCSAVCFAGALAMDKNEWRLLFEPEKCVACGLCTRACPLGLFELYNGK